MKIKIEGGIYFDPASLKHPNWPACYPPYRFCASQAPTFCDYVLAAPFTLEADVPDDFDPRPGMVDKLREKRKLVEREFARTVMEIDQRINSLLAIEMTP